MAVGAVVARILTQYSDKGSKQAQKDLMKLGKSFDAYAKKASRAVGLVAVATTAAAVKIGKDSVMAASDVAQQFGALDAVFGSNAKQLQDFSKSMVEYGLSTADAARFAALLGTQLKGLGLSEQDAIDRTKKLEVLAADLAATYGGTTADAVAALSSTFKGEYNPIERYGVAIRKSDITARVAAKGLKGLTGEALKAAEAQAAYELILNKTTAAQGQADREYNTLAAQLQRLDASYKNIEASLGEALLPIVQEFASYLLKDVIPGVQAWVDLNKDDLAASLKSAAGFAKDLLEYAGKIAKWSTENIGFIKAMGAAIGAMFVVGKITAFVSAVQGLIAVYRTLAASAGAAAVATAFATGGLNLAAGAVAIGGYAFLVQYLHDGNVEANKLEEQNKKVGKSVTDVTKLIVVGAAAEKYKADQAKKAADAKAKADKEAADAAARAAINDKKSLDAAKARAKFDADYAKINARIAKNYGVTLLSSEDSKLVQVNAAEALLKRQTTLDEVNKELLKTLREEVLLMKAKNDYALRYDDILKALADNKVSTSEVQILALKWGVTKEAVEAYLLQLKIIEDKQISDSEVIDLAKAWGSTQAQAAQYLDFFQALNDGFLDPAEIEKLKTKWGLTEQQVRQYADFVGVVNDGKLEDAEINKLKSKWKLTTDEVVAYILKIGSPVSYSGTLIDPATAATIGWKNAKDALQAYLDLLGKGTTTTTQTPTTTNPTLPQPSTGNVGNIDAVNKQVADAAKQLVSEITATGKSSVSISEVANDMAANLLKDKAATEALGGVSGVLSSARYTGQALQYAAQEAAKAKIADSEITAAALRQLTSGGTLTDDQRMRLGMGSTVNTAATITPSSSSAATTVNVTVNGSVTSENDLVQSIRNGLLRAQYNGNQINLAAL